MRKITLNGVEHPIKIDNGVLEAFEEKTKVNAFDFNQKSIVQFKEMSILALRNANKDLALTDAEISSALHLPQMIVLLEEFQYAILGPEGLNAVEGEKK